MKKEHLNEFDALIYNKLKELPTHDSSFVEDLIRLSKETDNKLLKKKLKSINPEGLNLCLKGVWSSVPISSRPKYIRHNTKYIFIGSKGKISKERKVLLMNELDPFQVKFMEELK